MPFSKVATFGYVQQFSKVENTVILHTKTICINIVQSSIGIKHSLQVHLMLSIWAKMSLVRITFPVICCKIGTYIYVKARPNIFSSSEFNRKNFTLHNFSAALIRKCQS